MARDLIPPTPPHKIAAWQAASEKIGEGVRDHVANGLQMLILSDQLDGGAGDVTIDRDTFDSVIVRLRGAIALLDGGQTSLPFGR